MADQQELAISDDQAILVLRQVQQQYFAFQHIEKLVHKAQAIRKELVELEKATAAKRQELEGFVGMEARYRQQEEALKRELEEARAITAVDIQQYRKKVAETKKQADRTLAELETAIDVKRQRVAEVEAELVKEEEKLANVKREFEELRRRLSG